MARSWRIAATCALLLAPAGAGAASGDDFVDFYTVPLTFLETPVLDSDPGFGVGTRGRFELTPDLLLHGEAQLNEYAGFDGADTDGSATQLRLGIAFLTPGDARVYGLFEFVKLAVEVDGFVDEDETGYGLHIGFRGEGESHFYAQVGFLDVGDADGLELLAGAAFRFTPLFGMFADYRVTTLESAVSQDTDLSDLRVGLRLNFTD